MGGNKSISICLLLQASSRPALPFRFWDPVSTRSHHGSASSGSAVCHPPCGGQALPWVWGSRGTRWKQKKVCYWLQCQYGLAMGTDLQAQCATFEIFVSKSSGMLLCHDIRKPLRNRHFLLPQWPDCPPKGGQPGPSIMARAESRRGDTSCSSLWGSCVPLGCCLLQEHIHPAMPTLIAHPCHVTWGGTSCVRVQAQREAWKKAPWAKCTLWLSVFSYWSSTKSE